MKTTTLSAVVFLCPHYGDTRYYRVVFERVSGVFLCIAEVNRSKITIIKQLSFKQRFQQGFSISNLALRVVTHCIRQRNPQLSQAEAHHLAIQKNI
jgi:hypothetical protein